MKIKYKIIIITIITLILFNSAFTLISIYSQKKQEIQRLDEKIKSTNKIIKETLSHSLWIFDRNNIEKGIESFLKNEEISHIKLIDNAKRMNYEKGSDRTDHTARMIIRTVDLEKDNRKLGTAIITYTSKNFNEKLAAFTNKMIYLTIGLILFTTLVIFWFIDYIVKPFENLLQGLKNVNNGNLNYRIEARTSDEFGILSDAFNQMSENLKKITVSHEELNREIQIRIQVESELRKALENVKTLKGFLPICSSCKNVRDDKGYWKQVEEYISENSDAEFSHTLCVDCIKKLYPEMSDKVLQTDQKTK